jgi:prophage regulatory protein
MVQVSGKKLLAAAGVNGNFETARLYWKKGSNPELQTGDWLLVPFNPSNWIPANGELVARPVPDLAAVIKALDGLRAWVEEQPTSFSLETAASDCFRIGRANLTSDIQAGLHLLLQDLGCTPLEKRTSASRFWYKPPPYAAPTVSTARDPPGKSGQDEKGNPSASSHEIYRISTVIRLSGLSRSSIYRLEALGLFPGRVKLSGSAVGWRSDEIHSWIASRKAAITKEGK